MDQISKQWQKLSTGDRARLKEVFLQLSQRDFAGLNRKRLKGYKHIYRVRVGNYRIIYFDDGQDLILKYLKQRNERTYREI